MSPVKGRDSDAEVRVSVASPQNGTARRVSGFTVATPDGQSRISYCQGIRRLSFGAQHVSWHGHPILWRS